MAAILIRRTRENNTVEMKRHDGHKPSSDAPPRADVQRSRSPQQPPGVEDAREALSAPASAAAAATSSASASRCDVTCSNTLFEHRDEQRSAFSSVRSAEKPRAEEPTQEQDKSPSATAHAPRHTAAIEGEDEPRDAQAEPLPFESPPRVYHQDPRRNHAGGERQPTDGGAPAPAPQYAYHYHQSYYDHYDYSSYYTPPSDLDSHTSRMTHPPSSHHQHYNYYPHDSHPYDYLAPQPPAYYQDAPPPASHLSMSDNILKEAPSAVTETSTPQRGRNTFAEGGGREGLEPSSSPSLEDDQKPAALKCPPKKGSPSRPQGQDYEPIPLDQIGAIPVLSSASATGAGHPLSPLAYAAAPSHQDAFHRPYEGTSYHHHMPYAASVPATPVAPPHPHSTPVMQRRPQQRVLLAPSSGGSTASSRGSEGGSWERRFNELLEFKRVHGHCEVPQSYAENTSLGTWVNKQRMEQKNRVEGKNSSLNDSRLERLESIGFRWAKRKGQASWDEKFSELVAYLTKHGNCHVPTKYKENTALGRWISTQRAEYKKYQEGQAKCSMNVDKIRRLESIGFAWFMAL